MRIVSGKWRGFNLHAPAGTKTRPTADRCKEALFSSLVAKRPELFNREAFKLEQTALEPDNFEPISCLDLCAGSGQIALEALSRGFDFAALVEIDRLACQAIKANILKCQSEAKTQLHKQTVQTFLNNWQKLYQNGFDLIFCDPPYVQASQIHPLVLEQASFGLLKPKGILVLEQASDLAAYLPELVLKNKDVKHELILFKTSDYGAAKLCYYQFKA